MAARPLTAGTVKLWPEGGKSTDVIPAGPINSDSTTRSLRNKFQGPQWAPPLGKYKVTVSTGVPPGPGSVLTPSADPSKTQAVKMTDVPPAYADQATTRLGFEVTATPSASQYDLNLLEWRR